MAASRFITFEGGEGTGKSTQCRRLARWLEGEGIDFIQTREIGGAPGAEAIRKLLVTGAAERWSPLAEALLVNAARDEHLKHTIRPALEAGKWVVCDRFLDSTRAYQGSVGGVDKTLIAALEDAVVAPTWPDLTIILDLDTELGLRRAHERAGGSAAEDRFENKGVGFHQRLRDAFHTIAGKAPERCVLIDADRGEEEIAGDIRQIIDKRLR